MKKMRIYISGPITGIEDYMDRFEVTEEMLKRQFPDSEYINPAKILKSMPPSTTWEEYMELSMKLIDMCEAVYMMENWKVSAGACIEYGYASAKNMIILNEMN